MFNKSVEQFNAVLKEERVDKSRELASYRNNREFITEVFYEVLDEGLRKVRLLKPSDPFEFLVI